jgi:hypothetical protein
VDLVPVTDVRLAKGKTRGRPFPKTSAFFVTSSNFQVKKEEKVRYLTG